MPELKALAPARIKWALELLALKKTISVLEIGCGSGIAAQHILSMIGRGCYLGIDQSAAAIEAAIARNRDPLNPGRAVFFNAEFNADDREPQIFDRILAVNVNAFWTGDGAEILDVRRLMHKTSLFVQVHETPNTAQRTKIARILEERLAPHFGTITTKSRTIAGRPLLGIVAAAPGAQKKA